MTCVVSDTCESRSHPYAMLCYAVTGTRDALDEAKAKLDAARAATTAAHMPGTGHGFIVFNRLEDACSCVDASMGGHGRRTADAWRLAAGVLVHHAPPAESLIWENLGTPARERRRRTCLAAAIMLLLIAGSTSAIVHVTILASRMKVLDAGATAGGTPEALEQMSTTLWTTVIIIVANLLIFAGVPICGLVLQRHESLARREVELTMSLFAFSTLSVLAAAVAVMITNGFDGIWFRRKWYEVAVPTVLNGLLADTFIITIVVEWLRVFDRLPAQRLVAPRQPTQELMNAAYAFNNELYMVFRQQIVLKWIALALFFGTAIPILYPAVGGFLALSLRVDRYNLLRSMLPPPQTSRMLSPMNVPRLVALGLLPGAALLHAFMAFGFLWALHADLTDNNTGGDA